MRIVAGEFGGRVLSVPRGRDIRPTSDKVRGAVMNALRSRGALEGAHVLDMFCGTGALGLEAISQGAASCIFADKARSSIDLARANAGQLGLGDAQAGFILADAVKFPAPAAGQEESISLVLLDPPYNTGLILVALEVLAAGNWLADGAIIVAESENGCEWLMPREYKILDDKRYGDTMVSYLRYDKTPE